jgi:hypothetical protein
MRLENEGTLGALEARVAAVLGEPILAVNASAPKVESTRVEGASRVGSGGGLMARCRGDAS